MKFCIVFEFAGPCRWFKKEKAGKLRRMLFLWFSITFFPLSWTDFLKKYREASVGEYLERTDQLK